MKKTPLFLLTTAIFWSIATPFLWKQEEARPITMLALVPHSRDEIKADAIAEWLDLSNDHPTFLESFDLREGGRKLINTGIFQQARLYKLMPETLVVSYTLKKPYAIIANWKNLGVDKEGNFFPLSPFFTPKELPEIVFPKQPTLDLQAQEFPYALKLLGKEPTLFPWVFAGVDLSRLDSEHPYGGELVLTLKNGDKRLFVRLWFGQYEETLSQFAALLPTLGEASTVDLRLSSKVLVY